VWNLQSRHLYLCVGIRPDMSTFLPAVLRGGVDIVQLREKYADRDAQRVAAREMRTICHEFDVPFIMNDDPELALEVAADGVHVGQDDVTVEHCRNVLGEQAIVGISTHADAEFANALPLAVRTARPDRSLQPPPSLNESRREWSTPCVARASVPTPSLSPVVLMRTHSPTFSLRDSVTLWWSEP
jgi:hypothetical protein